MAEELHVILVGRYVVVHTPTDELPWVVRRGTSDGPVVGEYLYKETAVHAARALRDVDNKEPST